MAEPQLSIRSAERESAARFYERLADRPGPDLDLEAVIKEARCPNSGPDL